MRDCLHQTARQGATTLEPTGSTKSERKHQEQISNLGERRICNQELQSLLTESDNASEYDRGCAKRSEQLRESEARQRRHDVEPEPYDDEEGSLHNQTR